MEGHLKGMFPKKGVQADIELNLTFIATYFTFLFRIQAENSKNVLYPREEPPYKFSVLEYTDR